MTDADRRTRRALVFRLLPVLLLALLAPTVASAHGSLVKSEPAPNSVLQEPPVRVTLWFAEPIEPRYSSIELLDSTGARVSVERAAPLPSDPTTLAQRLPRLKDGMYTVAWSNVSAIDGHKFSGSFVFSVGAVPGVATAPVKPAAAPASVPLLPSPLEPVFRWLSLISLLAIVGGLAFELLVWGPALRGAAFRGSHPGLRARVAKMADGLLWTASEVFLFTSIAHLLVKASAAAGVSFLDAVGRPSLDLLTGTRWGYFWALRMGFFLAFVALQWMRSGRLEKQGGDGEGRNAERAWLIAALAATAGIMLCTSVSSHAAADGLSAEAVFNDFLHFIAAGFWVGALFHFALLSRLLSSQAPGEKRPMLATVAARFSLVAIPATIALALTGLYNAHILVSRLPALVTPYGFALLAKVALFAVLLGIGAHNLLRLSPRLAGEGRARSTLRRSVAIEAGLGVAALVAAGFLVSLEPARQAAPPPARQALVLDQDAGGAHIVLNVQPGQVGSNRMRVTITDRSGKPIPEASQVFFNYRFLGTDLGDHATALKREKSGDYVLDRAELSVAGTWRAELNAVRPDGFDINTAIRFSLPVVAPPAVAAGPSKSLGVALFAAELVLLALLAGAMPLIRKRVMARAQP